MIRSSIFQSRAHSSVFMIRKNSGRRRRDPQPRRTSTTPLLLASLITATLSTGLFTPAQAVQQNATDRRNEAASIIMAEDASAEQRLGAARTLLRERRLAPLVEALSPVAPSASALAVAAAVRDVASPNAGGTDSPPPEELLRPLIASLERARDADKAAIIEALGAYATRDAIRAVIACIGADQPAPVRLAAFSALRRQTGREDLGTDVARWTSWWNEVQWLPEGEWRSLLARAQATRAARLDLERNALAERVVETHRRLFAATPHTDRSPLLAQMMRDELLGVRRLAFELADRELLNARPLGESVLTAVAERLKDDSPEIRAAAATLAGNLAGGAIHSRILDALSVELDPIAATAMLSVAARRPDDAGILLALKWLDSGLIASAPAAELLLAAAERGLLTSPAVRNEVRRVVRRQLESTAAPVLIRLVGAIGEPEDHRRLAEMLVSAPLESRLAAADALTPIPQSFDRLMNAARKNPELHAMARRAITLHRPTAEGWLLMRSLEGSSEQEARESLDRLAGQLGPREALRLAEALEDPADRAALLELRLGAMRERPDLLSTRNQLRLGAALAETRLQLGDPVGALEATEGLLESLPEQRFRASRRRVADARAASQLWLGRMEAPEVAEAPPAIWLEALERCIAAGLGHAFDLLSHIEGTMLERMTENEINRFRTIAAGFPAALRASGERSAPDGEPGADGPAPERGEGPDSTRIADGDDADQVPN